MSTAIPQSDAALLAAQAQAGQAGVLAYEAAKKEMAANRQQATQSAMTAAQARGAPRGAMEAALGQTNQMYDRRDAALTTAQAAYQDAMASRKARMADYSGGVIEARSLIGEQANLAAAPIDAQTRYSVANIEAKGRQNVDAINAQMRLKELEMQAAAAAAARRSSGGGGGGGGRSSSKGKLNDSDLKAMLSGRSGDKMAAAREAAAAALKKSQAQQRERAIRATSGESIPNIIRQSDRAAAAEKAAGGVGPTVTPNDFALGSHILPAQNYNDPWSIPGAGRFQGSTVAQTAEQKEKAAAIRAYSDSLINRYKTRVAQEAPLIADKRQSMFTPEAITALSNSEYGDILAPMFGSGQPIRSLADIDRVLMGDRTAMTNVERRRAEMDFAQQQWYGAPLSGGPQIPGLSQAAAEAAGDAQRQAMILSAIDLQNEGYDITEADLRNALHQAEFYKAGDSAYDVAQRGRGNLTAEEQAAADAEAIAEATSRKGESDAEQADIIFREDVRNATNGLSPEQIDAQMDDQTLWEIVNAEEWPNYARVAAELATGGDPFAPPIPEEDWVELVRAEGITDVNVIKILRAMNYG